jgi:serine/threonine protein kinase
MTPFAPSFGESMDFGRFRVIGRLAEGRHGTLYLATDPVGSRVAVKELWPDGDLDSRLLIETRMTRALRVNSLGIAPLLEVSLDLPPRYLAFGYVYGPTLTSRVAGRGPLTDDGLAAVAIVTAAALASVHIRGIAHGKMDPDHVRLGPDGPRLVGYAMDEPAGGPSADLLGWGSTVLYAATGRPTGEADSLPGRLATVVRRCLSEEPSLRPTSRDLLLHLMRSIGPTTLAP